MPYDDEIPLGGELREISEELNELSRRVIGAAIEVHRRLGAGAPEEAYEGAMCVELAEREIPFERQKLVEIYYKGVKVARGRIDLLIDSKLVVECKACEAFAPIHRLQTLVYIRTIKQPLGLLINFWVPILKEGIRRIIDSRTE
jgi:GxxExxY protein